LTQQTVCVKNGKICEILYERRIPWVMKTQPTISCGSWNSLHMQSKMEQLRIVMLAPLAVSDRRGLPFFLAIRAVFL